jgi:cation diffusion facilitator family transporter
MTDPRPPGRGSPLRYARISIAAAVATILLKGGAFALTGSVALLSDALESLTNLVAAVVALVALAVAVRPADEEHAYGHTKAEYFASGFEGALVLAAALIVLVTAVSRLFDPRPLEHVPLGLAITALASAINFGVARLLLGAAQRYGSIALEADARHLLTDVWTSAGVIVGVGAAALTGWERLDAIVAIAVALHIARTGFELVRRSMLGLLDTALPPEIQATIHSRAGPLRRARRPVPRAADPPSRIAALHLVPRPGARELDRAGRARPGRGDRGRDPGEGAEQHRVHAPRAGGGPGLVAGYAARAAEAAGVSPVLASSVRTAPGRPR